MSDESNSQPQDLRNRFAGILCIIAAIIVFALPFKFGGIVGIPEVLYFPDDIFQWALFTWPPVMFPVISSLFLALSIFAAGNLRLDFKFILAMIWILLALSSLIGFKNASTMDFPIQEVSHFFGIACFTMSIYFLLEARPDMRELLLNAVILALVVSLFMGLQQFLWGFKETLNYVYEQEIKTGLRTTWHLQNRLEQTRVYSPFTLCNSLAAHLVLTIPLCLVLIWRSRTTLKAVIIVSATALFLFYCGNVPPAGYILISLAWAAVIMFTLFRFPEEYTRPITATICIIFAILMFSILYFTGSRAAVLAFGMALAVTAAVFPFNIRIRIASASSILAATAVGFYFINAGRNMGSMTVRFDYFAAAIKIFLWNVFAGTGWGDFFHQYPSMKTFPGTEAPHSSHNFVLDFASQTGAFGLIMSVVVLLFPLVLILYANRWKMKMPDYIVNIAIILGWTAWGIHSLADINCQVPASVATAILMVALLKFAPEKDNPATSMTLGKGWTIILKLAACLLALFTFWISSKRLDAEYYQWQLMQLCEASPVNHPEATQPNPEKVEAALRIAIAKMPYSPFPWASAGNYAQATNHWGTSELFFQKAVELSPERASFYHKLFLAQMMLGKKKEALESIRRASLMFPNNEEYKKSYEKLSAEMGK